MHGQSYNSITLAEELGYHFRPKSYMAEEFEFLEETLLDPETNLMDTSQHPLAFAAKHRDEDTPLYNEAMRGPHREGYREAMRQEIEQLEERKTWTIAPRPQESKVVPGTWAFRAKRYPHGALRKLKA